MTSNLASQMSQTHLHHRAHSNRITPTATDDAPVAYQGNRCNMKSRYILSFVLALLFTATCVSDPVDELEPEVRQTIKLSTKNLPIHRYFADDDGDNDSVVYQQDLNVRRDTSIKLCSDTDFAEDDYVISDEIALRLMLARIKALNKHHEIHGVDNT